MRSSWDRVAPKTNGSCPYRRQKRRDTRGDGHLRVVAERNPAGASRGLPVASKSPETGWSGWALSFTRRINLANTLLSGFWPPKS